VQRVVQNDKHIHLTITTQFRKGNSMGKKVMTSNKTKTIGPYSPAVEAGGFIFISGQIPVNPATGEIIPDIAAATDRILTNIREILAGEGLSLSSVVKTTIFLTDMNNFSTVNEIYSGFFSTEPPARSTLGVNSLPKGAPLEIEAIAVRKR